MTREKIDSVMNEVATLISDLEGSQNPAFVDPTKEDIIDVLKKVLECHSTLEWMLDDAQSAETEANSADEDFDQIDGLVSEAIKHLEQCKDIILLR